MIASKGTINGMKNKTRSEDKIFLKKSYKWKKLPKLSVLTSKRTKKKGERESKKVANQRKQSFASKGRKKNNVEKRKVSMKQLEHNDG